MVATPVLLEDQDPPATVELNVVFPLTQTLCVPLSVPADGVAVTVTVLVAVAFEHPPEPVTVYVIVAVPAATPLIAPVDELIVAILVLLELQLPPVCVELNVLDPPTHILCVPLNVPAPLQLTHGWFRSVHAHVDVDGFSFLVQLPATR